MDGVWEWSLVGLLLSFPTFLFLIAHADAFESLPLMLVPILALLLFVGSACLGLLSAILGTGFKDSEEKNQKGKGGG